MDVPREGRSGFSLLPAERTGIRFTNVIDDRLIMSNNNFMSGSGLALGDFDGDGWCDVYFCAIDGTNRLYRNHGNWTFEDVTERAGVGAAGWHSTGAVFADVDGDRDLDLIVNTLGRGTHCFRNMGEGRFREVTDEAGLKSTTGSLGLALADIEGDGDLDLYVANYGTLAILRAGGRAEMKQVDGKWQVSGPYADRLRFVDGRLEEVGEVDVLYRNDGQGRFTPVSWGSEAFLDVEGKPMAAPWDFGLGVQMRDINEDGAPDIYVCNDFQTVDRLWLNDGAGRFRLLPRLAMRQQSYASMGVDFADIDRDGRLDFFVVEMLSRDHARRVRQVSGASPVIPVPGRIDNRPEVGRNTLFWNRGDGTYAEIACFAGVEASEWSWQPVFLDVDLDGYEDLLVVNGNAFDVQDRDVIQQVRGLGKQTPEQTRTNILLYPRLDTPNVAFRNRGNLTFAETGQAWGFDSRQISHGIALADFDRDGDLDAMVNCLYAAPLIYRNESSAARVAVRLWGNPTNVQGIGAKLKLMGGAVPLQSQEVVSGGRYLAGDDPVRVFAAGSSANRMRLEVTWRSGRRSVLENVQANRIYEVDEGSAEPPPASNLVSAPAPPLFTDASDRLNHAHREDAFDDYARQPLLPRQLSTLGPGVAWFDLNNDGHDDLILGAGRGGQVNVFLGNGQGKFANITPTSAVILPDDATGLAGLVTANGRRILLAGIATYENATHKAAVGGWELDVATGRLAGGPIREIPFSESSTGPLAVADYDGDGDLDVFVAGRVVPGSYPKSATSRLFRQENSHLFLDQTNQLALQEAGLVSGAVWSELDGDGFPELVLACEWGPLKIFRNNRGQLTAWNPPVVDVDTKRPMTLAELTGWWNSVTAGDIDGDGRLDLVAGNFGLNSTYNATPDHPAQLYYGDLGGNGVVDLVEAYSERGVVLPRRGLAALSQAMPRLGESFPTVASFSVAPASSLFKGLRAVPEQVRATALASMVFFNRGDRFEAVPLPPEAQWAPVFGTVVADFDGDGRQDLFLAQNLFALRPELSRQDAGRGLLLRGTGEGRLTAISGQSSGVAIYGEQRGAAAGDFDEDGRIDLVVSQNGAPTRLFHNTGGRPGLRVRLIGSPGNPSGVGAVVRLQSPKGSGPAVTVLAGEGYWSQSSIVPVLSTDSWLGARVAVLWPGGKRSEFAVPADARELSLSRDRALRLR